MSHDAPRMSTRITIDPHNGQILLDSATLEIDAFDLGRLTLTIAAEILHFCSQTHPGTTQQPGQPQNPVLRVLTDRGIDRVASDTNYLIYKAQWLYEIVKAEVASGGPRVLWTTGQLQNRLRAESNAHR
jgi:hypothetical protein